MVAERSAPDHAGTLCRSALFSLKRVKPLPRKDLKMHDPRKLAIRLFLTMPFMVASTPAAIGAVHGIERSNSSHGQQQPRGHGGAGLTEETRRTGLGQDDASDAE